MFNSRGSPSFKIVVGALGLTAAGLYLLNTTGDKSSTIQSKPKIDARANYANHARIIEGLVVGDHREVNRYTFAVSCNENAVPLEFYNDGTSWEGSLADMLINPGDRIKIKIPYDERNKMNDFCLKREDILKLDKPSTVHNNVFLQSSDYDSK